VPGLSPVESYRHLKVWQRAIEMSLAIYRATTAFPKEAATPAANTSNF
jgi:hypothetical protein